MTEENLGDLEGSQMNKSLCQVPMGQIATITLIEGGHGFQNRILSMGLHPGNRVKVIRSSPFKGPLLIENLDQGFCLALGRGMAAKIMVDEEEG